jgi:HD-like signal output (HDOD) protein
MFKLRPLFSLPKKKALNREALTLFPPDLVLQNGNIIVTAESLDEKFHGLLLGAHSSINTDLNQFESTVLKEIKDLLQHSAKSSDILPRLPLIVPKVMKLLRINKTSSRKISELIEKDPVLVGDVMKLTNSPYYRTRRKITSLQQATVVLGSEGLRRLVANALIKPLINLRSGHFSRIGSPLLWEQAEKTAIASSVICKGKKESEETQFHAYLLGILQNIGFTIGFRVLDKAFDGTQAPNSKEFQLEFARQSRFITSQVARSWSMPSQICDALDSQSKMKCNESSSALSETLYIADRIAKAQILRQSANLNLTKTKILLNQQPCHTCRKALDAVTHSE